VSNLGERDSPSDQMKREKRKIDIVYATAWVAKFTAFGTITEEFGLGTHRCRLTVL
jgi:hypothetical protein